MLARKGEGGKSWVCFLASQATEFLLLVQKIQRGVRMLSGEVLICMLVPGVSTEGSPRPFSASHAYGSGLKVLFMPDPPQEKPGLLRLCLLVTHS